MATTTTPRSDSVPATVRSRSAGPAPNCSLYSSTPHISARSHGPVPATPSAIGPVVIRTSGRSRQRSVAAAARSGAPSMPSTDAPDSPSALVSTPEPQPRSTTRRPGDRRSGASSPSRAGEKWYAVSHVSTRPASSVEPAPTSSAARRAASTADSAPSA